MPSTKYVMVLVPREDAPLVLVNARSLLPGFAGVVQEKAHRIYGEPSSAITVLHIGRDGHIWTHLRRFFSRMAR
jgi:hypothetical protein